MELPGRGTRVDQPALEEFQANRTRERSASIWLSLCLYFPVAYVFHVPLVLKGVGLTTGNICKLSRGLKQMDERIGDAGGAVTQVEQWRGSVG